VIVRRGILAGLACLALLVTACDDKGGDPLPTHTSTVVPSTTTTIASRNPTMPAAAKQPTPDGATAFFQYFFDLYTHAYLSLDTASLGAVSSKECKFCTSAISHVESARRAGNTIKGGAITVTTAVAAPGDPNTGLLVNGVVDQEKGITYTRSGSIYSTAPASKGSRVDAVVIWVDSHWMMRAVEILS
jgi:hypothetical protein